MTNKQHTTKKGEKKMMTFLMFTDWDRVSKSAVQYNDETRWVIKYFEINLEYEQVMSVLDIVYPEHRENITAQDLFKQYNLI